MFRANDDRKETMMKNKRLLLLALLLATALLVVACTPQQTPATPTPAPVVTDAPAAEEPAAEEKALELTVEELAKFNGKDGQPAYIAVDGIIYDVSNHPAWKDGGHNGFEAGKDLTTEIKEKSPHGVGKLTEAVEVGKLVP